MKKIFFIVFILVFLGLALRGLVFATAPAPYKVICHHTPANSVTLSFQNEQSYSGHLGTPHSTETYDTDGACTEPSVTPTVTLTVTTDPSVTPTLMPSVTLTPTNIQRVTDMPTPTTFHPSATPFHPSATPGAQSPNAVNEVRGEPEKGGFK